MPSVIESEAFKILGNAAQALPTNGPLALAVQALVPVPTTPASPLTVEAPKPLAVQAIDPPAPPPPAPKAFPTKTLCLLGAIGLGLWWLNKRK